LPSQQQVKWSQLRVGLTVLVASIALAVLIFLMSGTAGILTRKIYVRAYFQNSSGLAVGAPVRLQGVDIGNVKSIRIVAGRPKTPVEVTMKLTTRYLDSLYQGPNGSTATLATAGVLGATYVDIDSSTASGEHLKDGAELRTTETPDLQDVIRSSQTSLQNVDVVVRRLNQIVAAIQSGEGSVGKLIYDPGLYNRANQTLNEVQKMVNQISAGKGSIGKLVASDELYDKLNTSVDKLNRIIDQVESGQGTAGKLLKDPSLYNNANEAISKVNRLVDDVNSGKGALGKFAKDEEFARKLDNTITKLSILSDRMESGQGTVGKLFNDPALYNNADQMLLETRNLVKAIRENPKKYLVIHFKIF
jgi:phospholipid/cholesterol/gamma-HCH transport system substrate-binding protein